MLTYRLVQVEVSVVGQVDDSWRRGGGSVLDGELVVVVERERHLHAQLARIALLN